MNLHHVELRLSPRYSSIVIAQRDADVDSVGRGDAVVVPFDLIRAWKKERWLTIDAAAELVLVFEDSPSELHVGTIVDLARQSNRPVLSVERFAGPNSVDEASIVTFGAVTDDGNVEYRVVSNLVLEAVRLEIGELKVDLDRSGQEWTVLRDRYLQVRQDLSSALELRNTTSFRLGHALVRTARRPRQIVGEIQRARTRDRTTAGRRPSVDWPDRTTTPQHPDHDWLWKWRTAPEPAFFAFVGRRQNAKRDPRLLSLRPHDASAVFANTEPSALVVETGADEFGELWWGLGGRARPHLGPAFEHVVSLARRRHVPVVVWKTTPVDDRGSWLRTVEKRADMVIVDPDLVEDGGDTQVLGGDGLSAALDAIGELTSPSRSS